MQIKSDKPENKVRLLILWLFHNDKLILPQICGQKNYYTPKFWNKFIPIAGPKGRQKSSIDARLRVWDLAMLGNRSNYDFLHIFKCMFSTTLERHDSLMIDLQEEIYIICIATKGWGKWFFYRICRNLFEKKKQVELYFLPWLPLHCVITSTNVVRITR